MERNGYEINVNISSVALGVLFDFFLLLEGITALHVAFLTVDDLISQAFGNGLVVLEGSLPSSAGQEIDSLVDSSDGGDIHSLLSHGTSTTDSGGVFSGASNLDGSDEDLDGVSASQQVDDLESVSHNSDSLDLLAGVPAVELHGSNQSLDDGAQSFSELLSLISASSVGNIHLGSGGLDCNVVDETRILDFDIFV